MKKRTPVSEIMTTNLITINYNEELDVAEQLFKKHHIRHIPVTREGNVVGILSYTDLLRISFVDAVSPDTDEVDTVVYNMFSLEQVMVKNVISVTPGTTIREVAEILTEEEFHSLLVMEGDELKGIVTTTDLMKYLLEQF